MKKRMMKIMCCFVFGGTFLLLLPSIVLSQCSAYICSPACTYYTSIKDAIYAAAQGATIYVTDTCEENIDIWWAKPGIKLVGVTGGVNPAVIKGQVLVGAENITIRGFKITGGIAGIALYKGASAMIYDNTIEGTGGHGIMLLDTATARIYDNTIQENLGDGIFVSNSSSARIGFDSQTNTVPKTNWIGLNKGNGITIANSSSAQIVGNDIIKNAGDGIKVARVSQADISMNNIDGNNGNGIFVTQNSGVNLGNDTGETIFDLPNDTDKDVRNELFGLKGTMGGYADGRLGTLNGSKGPVWFDFRSINSTWPWFW